MLPSYYLFYVELSIPVSYIPTSLSKSESVITSSSSPVLAGWLYAPYKPAMYIIFAVLNLILNCPGLKLAVAVHRGLPTRRPLPCVPCIPYVPIRSSDIAQHRFWPVKAWDGWLSPPVLKVGNARKTPASPWLIACCFHLYNLACSYSHSC